MGEIDTEVFKKRKRNEAMLSNKMNLNAWYSEERKMTRKALTE